MNHKKSDLQLLKFKVKMPEDFIQQMLSKHIYRVFGFCLCCFSFL